MAETLTAGRPLRRLLLQMLFGKEAAPPALYVALFGGEGEPLPNEADLPSREIRGEAYQRQVVRAVDVDLDEVALTAKVPVYFINTSDTAWPPARGCFLTTAQQGEGTIIAHMMFDTGRVWYAKGQTRIDIEVEL